MRQIFLFAIALVVLVAPIASNAGPNIVTFSNHTKNCALVIATSHAASGHRFQWDEKWMPPGDETRFDFKAAAVGAIEADVQKSGKCHSGSLVKVSYKTDLHNDRLELVWTGSWQIVRE
ncbi:MAG TPA: hypothetical protein VF741_10410 [Candidatus Aquilonibacter sp.]